MDRLHHPMSQSFKPSPAQEKLTPKMNGNAVPPSSVGIDIGKEICHAVGAAGKIAFRWKIKCLALKEAFEKLPTPSWESKRASDLIPILHALSLCGHSKIVLPNNQSLAREWGAKAGVGSGGGRNLLVAK
jgi:hypothetical protein